MFKTNFNIIQLFRLNLKNYKHNEVRIKYMWPMTTIIYQIFLKSPNQKDCF